MFKEIMFRFPRPPATLLGCSDRFCFAGRHHLGCGVGWAGTPRSLASRGWCGSTSFIGDLGRVLGIWGDRDAAARWRWRGDCLGRVEAPGGNQTCFLLLIPSKIPRALFVRLDLICGLPSLREIYIQTCMWLSFFAFTACFTTAHRNHDNVYLVYWADTTPEFRIDQPRTCIYQTSHVH